ncbi:MAG TPA: GTPase Era [Polyangiaceae bacterium]|jgi:GTP-binding protein Era|nr:GTPase Era [Polyangiaceae bacterium]
MTLRAGTVALVGRSNVGKSTLLNAALELPLAIVSRTPQTTRDRLLGIVRHGDAEIGLLDTPGLHHAKTPLGRAMNRAARTAAREADVLVMVVAVAKAADLAPHPEDLKLLRQLPSERPIVLVINKIDRVRDKRALLPLLDAYSRAHELAAIVPISALREDGVTRMLDEVARLLPEQGPLHEPDAITDRPMRWFAAEYVRESILEATSQEVPHAVAVTIDAFVEEENATVIEASIHVERDGQKAILIGERGQMLKRIGTRARHRIEELLGRQVQLELWVRVTKNWRQRPELLADMTEGRER